MNQTGVRERGEVGYDVARIAAAVLLIGATISPAQDLRYALPPSQEPIRRAFPTAPAEQSPASTGKFVIFTREEAGQDGDFVAGAWECIPSRPETPPTKRLEFCHSSWNAGPLVNTLVRDDSDGLHPRFVRLQVNHGDRDYAVNLYDIDYRTWEVRCLWQGRRLTAFGVLGDSIFCDSSEGWLLLDAARGTLNRNVPFIPLETDGNYWLVRRPGETEGCWSYDRTTRRFIARFGPIDIPEPDFSQSWLSPDGRSRAWVLAPMPQGWRGGTLKGSLVLQRPVGIGDVAVPIEIQAQLGRGVPVIPLGIDLTFSPDGQVEFRARSRKNNDQDNVWTLDIASGNVRSAVAHRRPVDVRDAAVLDGVPVPDYLRDYVGELRHFGRAGLAPAFLLHLGILKNLPEYPDCTAGVSRDGRHVLYAARKGRLSGSYIYGDVLTKHTVRWKAPAGLDCREAQEFVWVETPETVR